MTAVAGHVAVQWAAMAASGSRHRRAAGMTPGNMVFPSSKQKGARIAAGPPRPYLFDCGDAYLAAIRAFAMSSMRVEKPYSLSYHDSTFTRVPSMTRVCVES